MLKTMSARDFNEWAIFYEIDPFGEQRGDIQAGIIASTAANLQRGKNTKPFTPTDFMLFIKKPEYRIDDAEIERRIENFMRRY